MGEPVPKVLGRYELQEEIGRGMMGVVYRALDPALGRTVALKTVRLAFSVPEGEREVFEKRFLAEARVAAGLSHPGIVVVHDVGRDAETGTLYIALEFLHGRTLAQMTEAGHGLEWREALRVTARIADALHHAHAQGIVHRDVKPANIMVLPSGDPKIMDFGIAKVPASQLTGAGEFFGTPSYMSPEQTVGETLDGRSDLFSLGSVLYLLLTGKRAFDAANVPAILSRVSSQDPPPPSALVPGLPDDVDYLVARSLGKKPSDRYPDGRSFAEDIDDVLTGRPPRHRQGWQAPERAEGTWVSVEPLEAGPAGAPSESARVRGLRGTASLPPPSTAPRRVGEASLLGHATARLGKGGLATLAALVAAAFVIALLLARRPAPGPSTAGAQQASTPASEEPAPGSSPTPAGSSFFKLPFTKDPGRLEVTFEHGFKSGTFTLWVDEDQVLEEPLTSRVVKKLGIVKTRKGYLKKVLDVAPGEHVIKVQVKAGDFVGAASIRGQFDSGKTRRLEVNKEGLPLLKKELALDWS